MNVSHATHNIANKLGSMNTDELMFLNNQIVGLIKAKRAQANKQAKRGLFAGTEVSFTDNNGQPLTGKVIKTMRKFAKVDTGNAIWRVPMHALTKV